MKLSKLIFAFSLPGGFIYLSPSEVMAQTVSTAQVDPKTQAKLEKAKEKLAKKRDDHS